MVRRFTFLSRTVTRKVNVKLVGVCFCRTFSVTSGTDRVSGRMVRYGQCSGLHPNQE